MYAKSQEDLLDKSEINIVHDLIPFNVLIYFSIYLVLRNSMYNNHLPYYKERTTEDLDKGIKRYVILVTYLKWFGSHRTLPVGLIAKNSSEITDYINESKNEPTWKFKFRIKLLKMTLNLVMGLFCGLLRPRLDIRAPLNTTTTYAANTHKWKWTFLRYFDSSLLQCSTTKPAWQELGKLWNSYIYQQPPSCFFESCRKAVYASTITSEYFLEKAA